MHYDLFDFAEKLYDDNRLELLTPREGSKIGYRGKFISNFFELTDSITEEINEQEERLLVEKARIA